MEASGAYTTKHSLDTGSLPPAKRSKRGKKKALKSAELQPPRHVSLVAYSKKHDIFRDPRLTVQLSSIEKATQIQLSPSCLSAMSHGGYRMVRATHGAYYGTWYFEVSIMHLGESGHCRLGWSGRKGELQGPVGYDAHSFGYRDIEGSKVHKAMREDYGEAYAEGDVVGCILHLPAGGRPLERDKMEAVSWKGRGPYFIEEPEPEPIPLQGSLVSFSKNGALQGIAYRDIPEGTYYPAASLYTLPQQERPACVTFNFGPGFQFPPSPSDDWPEPQPVSALPELPPPQPQPPQQSPQGTALPIDALPSHEDHLALVSNGVSHDGL